MSSPTRAAALTRVLGRSGRRYLIERTLQNKVTEYGRVYLASSQDRKFVLKSVPQDQFQYYRDMFDDLRDYPYVRVADDTVPEHSMFAYKYVRDHLPSFLQKDRPLSTKKRILRNALRGIATLHDKGIVHTDIKPNNILIEWKDHGEDILVEQVQIADIEDAAYVPNGCVLEGQQRGNWIWRSPEAHVAGPMHKPTDMFSFGLVCMYAIMKPVVLVIDESKLPEGSIPEDIVIESLIERQLSYCSDWNSVRGLIDYYGSDDPRSRYFTLVASNVIKGSPVSIRPELEPDFKDLIVQMMKVDPRQRLTAKEALAHRWFKVIPE